MNIGPDDIVFILGAGASMPAQIKGAYEMIQTLEEALQEDPPKTNTALEFQEFKDLYYQIKSSILYAQGLRGIYSDSSEFEYHIETLVRATFELERYLEHPLYPFIANWNQRFLEHAGRDFSILRKFSMKLRNQLRKWIIPSDYKIRGRYYSGFKTISNDIIQFPLRIFSLNYDLCLEAIADSDFVIEQGFDNNGIWNWRRMQSDIGERENQEMARANAYLYKMHGSIDWIREVDGRLKRIPDPDEVNAELIQIIFGREDKMTLASSDPYLYYISQFRASLHQARLIVCIGYSFGDKHINSSISAALLDEAIKTKCLSVTILRNPDSESHYKDSIAKKLKVPPDLLEVYHHGAVRFLTSENLDRDLLGAMPPAPHVPF